MEREKGPTVLLPGQILHFPLQISNADAAKVITIERFFPLSSPIPKRRIVQRAAMLCK